MGITIRDVAKLAGVSVSTVSLVLRNKECRVSPETRRRILEAADQLNYVPNQIAVSLVTGKTHTIGLIYADMFNPLYAAQTVALERAAQAQGYHLLICNCDNSVERCIQNIVLLESRGIDGFVLQPPATINANPEQLEQLQCQLRNCRTPYIILDYAIHDVFHDFIAADHRIGGDLAADLLTGLGHKRIGCITGNFSDYGSRHRLEGFRKGLEKHGVPFDASLIYYGNYQIESGYHGALELFKKDITAIFAFSDRIALGVQNAASECGISIPRDMSLIGYDDSVYANICPVPITTVHQPVEILGRRSFEILMERILYPDHAHKDYLYPPALIQRASCSVPRNAGISQHP